MLPRPVPREGEPTFRRMVEEQRTALERIRREARRLLALPVYPSDRSPKA